MVQKRPLRERFLEKVQKTESCWNWTACKDVHGYGQINEGGKSHRHPLAHRVAYQLFVGPIPENTCVLHKCDNPNCVNPDHLWLGTRADNLRDMREKGRQWRILTQEQVQEIRGIYQRYSRKFGGGALGRRYGVGKNEILSIIHNRTWAKP